MGIKKIFKRDLQNLEHYQFASHVYTMCKEANIAKLTLVLPPLLTAINAEDAALNQPRKEDGTKDLEQLDATRDQSYRALQLLVELHLHSDDAATKTAAEAVSEVLSRYPKAAQMNYDKESGALKNLIADLRTPALTPHVTKLAAAAYIARLEKDNNAFDTRYRSRLKAAVPAGTFDVKQLRAATDAALNAVVLRMQSLDDLEPATPNLSALITQYNALVEKRRATLSHRSATGESTRAKRQEERAKREEEKAKKAEEKAKLTELKRAEETAKSQEDFKALLQPLFPEFEAAKGLPAGSLSFTGSFVGSGTRRHYELAVTSDGKTSKLLWVSIAKNGKLKEEEAPKRK